MLSKTDPTLYDMCRELVTKQVHIDKPSLFSNLRMTSMLVANEGEKSGAMGKKDVIEMLDSIIEAMTFITIAQEQTEYIQEHLDRKEARDDEQ